MNSASSINFFESEFSTEAPTTVLWSESKERNHEKYPWLRIARNAGFAALLFVSPVTAISDPWSVERRRRDAVVTVSIYQELVGRFISRSEALRKARRILERAEQERRELVELEATRGIQWSFQE